MLKPDEVLDMSLDVFQAYVSGFSEHMADLEIIGIQTGYWSAYFQSKKPKSLKSIIDMVTRARGVEKQKSMKPEHSDPPAINVEDFLLRDAQFKQRYAKLRGGI